MFKASGTSITLGREGGRKEGASQNRIRTCRMGIAHSDTKVTHEVADSLELGLQAIVCSHMWVL